MSDWSFSRQAMNFSSVGFSFCLLWSCGMLSLRVSKEKGAAEQSKIKSHPYPWFCGWFIVSIYKTSWNWTLEMATFLVCKLYLSKFEGEKKCKERPVFIWALFPGHGRAQALGRSSTAVALLVSGKFPTLRDPWDAWLLLTMLSKAQERLQASLATSCCSRETGFHILRQCNSLFAIQMKTVSLITLFISSICHRMRWKCHQSQVLQTSFPKAALDPVVSPVVYVNREHGQRWGTNRGCVFLWLEGRGGAGWKGWRQWGSPCGSSLFISPRGSEQAGTFLACVRFIQLIANYLHTHCCYLLDNW